MEAFWGPSGPSLAGSLFFFLLPSFQRLGGPLHQSYRDLAGYWGPLFLFPAEQPQQR